jgi:hypothetical protein
MSQGNWRKEFGEDFDIPKEIESQLVDISWHNDVSPSFCDKSQKNSDGGFLVRLWVDHPIPEQRESNGSRFCVDTNSYQGESELLYQTEHLDEALRVLAEQVNKANDLLRERAAWVGLIGEATWQHTKIVAASPQMETCPCGGNLCKAIREANAVLEHKGWADPS